MNNSKFESIFPLIAAYLPVEDLLIYRLINKKFKQLCDQSNGINKLVIGNLKFYDNNWRFNQEEIDNEKSIDLQFYKRIRSLSIFNLDQNLKYLKINYCDKNLQIENVISNLINLEVLEIENIFFGNQNVNLDNLKIFIIVSSNLCSNCKFNLNTPKLDRIKFPNIDCVNFISEPNSIKHLSTTNYDDELDLFRNLEIMELNLTEDYLDSTLLSIFRQLKVLKIFYLTNLDAIYDGIRDDLIYILQRRLNPVRDIVIYFNGVRLDDIGKFKEFELCKTVLEYQIKNFNLLDKKLDIKSLYYHQLEDCVNDLPNNLPFEFFEKYSNLLTIYATRVKNVANLNWFLKNVKKLEELNLSNYSLDQKFYDDLPKTIKILIIDSNNAYINCDFILNMKNLCHFSINDDIDLFDFAIKSFLDLKYLKGFQFYFKGNEIGIFKVNGYFDLMIGNRLVKEGLHFGQLESTFNDLKSNEEYFSDDDYFE